MRRLLLAASAAVWISGCAASKPVVQKPAIPAASEESTTKPAVAVSDEGSKTKPVVPVSGEAPKTKPAVAVSDEEPKTKPAAAVSGEAPKTTTVGPDQIATLPAGRFVQVIGRDPRNRYEGTVVRGSADELVLTDVISRTVEEVPLLGDLPFHWARRLFASVMITAQDKDVPIRRRKIAAVLLFDEQEGQRRLAEQRSWRAELGRGDQKNKVQLTGDEQFGTDL